MNELLKLINVGIMAGNKQLLSNINLTVSAGDFIVLRGGNGSGKSSLIKCILGRREKTIALSGQVFFDGSEYLHDKKLLENFSAQVGYVSQSDKFYCATAYFEIYNALESSDRKVNAKARIVTLFEQFNLARLLSKKPKTLSGGEKRMLSILKGLVRIGSSQLFFIDEPLNNLDAQNSMRVANFIMRMHELYPSIAIVLVTHCPMFSNATNTYQIISNHLSPIQPTCLKSCYTNIDNKGYFIL